MRLRLLRAFDPTLFLIPFILTVIGVVVIYSITYAGPSPHLAFQQGIFGLIGLGLLLFFTFFDYRNLRGLAGLLYASGLVLLLLVALPKLIPALHNVPIFVTSFGATRWINLGIFQLQPSEIEKVVLLVALSAFLSREDATRGSKALLASFLLIAVPVGLVLLQPDLGTAIALIVGAAGMLLVAGFPRILLAASGFMFLAASPLAWFLLRDYQRTRLLSFINPAKDPLGSGYNVLQSQITVGSGGIFGRGLGFGSQSQLNFLPVAHTDFIFAGLAEATGFVGAFVVLVLIAVLLLRMLNVAQVAHDKFGMLLAVGLSINFFVHVMVNVGMNLGLLPVTGIPLPFVSAGGTSLMVNMIALGILQSIYIRRKKITF